MADKPKRSLCERWEAWNIDCPLSMIIAVFCAFIVGAFMCAMVIMIIRMAFKAGGC